MDKLKYAAFARRRVFHINKNRQRKKFLKKAWGLYLDYCCAHYGGLQGLFYGMYSGDDRPESVANLRALIYNENPLLNLVPKDDSWGGSLYPPIQFGTPA